MKLVDAGPPPSHGIWPEHVQAFSLYRRMQTQWRVAGFGSLIGMDCSNLEFWLGLERIPRELWPATVDALQIMEAEALCLMREKADK